MVYNRDIKLPANVVKMFRSLTIFIGLVIVASLLGAGSPTLGQVQGMQTFDNRKEGTNVRPNAAPDLKLIAVHRSFQIFEVNSNLRVRFFLPPVAGNRSRKVSLEAVELQDSFHYFMEATNQSTWKDNTWNLFAPWPTKDVIDKLGLQPNNIGVLARYEVAGAPAVYLPVDVFQNDGNTKKGTYTFHFITRSELQSLDVSVTNEKGAVNKSPKLQLSCNRNYNPNCKLYAAGSTQAFTLDMSALQPGEFHIKLLGRIPGNTIPISLDLVIYHQL